MQQKTRAILEVVNFIPRLLHRMEIATPLLLCTERGTQRLAFPPGGLDVHRSQVRGQIFSSLIFSPTQKSTLLPSGIGVCFTPLVFVFYSKASWDESAS